MKSALKIDALATNDSRDAREISQTIGSGLCMHADGVDPGIAEFVVRKVVDTVLRGNVYVVVNGLGTVSAQS